jgi:hypothetical protein
MRRMLLFIAAVLLAISGAIVWTTPDWLLDTIAEQYRGEPVEREPRRS